MITGTENTIFGSRYAKFESELKQPGLFKEAVIYEYLSHMGAQKIKEFARSPEARTMLKEGIISSEIMDKLNSECGEGKCLSTVSCHFAKEDNNPLFDELLAVRAREKELMCAIIDEYRDKAADYAENLKTDVIDKCIPKTFL